jgi:hypothetical protein
LRRFSPATILAAIALFVALTGTAVAGANALITGAQIKNGSIGLADLSGSAKAALKGKRGPAGQRGAAGLAGPAGLPGPAGPAGPKGVEVVKHYKASKILAPGAIDGLAMVCPAGEGVLSGGGYSGIGFAFSDHVAGNGWVYLVENASGISITIDGYITCAPGVTVGAVGPVASSVSSVKQQELAAYANH